MVVIPAVVPRAFVLEIEMVPAEIVVSPEYVLVPDNVKVPTPVFIILPVEIAIGSLMDDVPTESMVKL